MAKASAKRVSERLGTTDWYTAPAKVNFFLKISGLRADGLHLLQTLMSKISLADRLRIKAHENGGRFTLICPQTPELQTDSNLCLRAAAALKPHLPVGLKLPYEGTIELEKNIPLAAGLGGGSSDAASCLQALCQLYALELSEAKLFKIAASLGADVPFFLRPGSWILGGIGEQFVRPVKIPALGLLLLYPDLRVDSGWAYKALDKQNFSLTTPPADDTAFRSLRDVYDVVNIMENDLAPVVEGAYPTVLQARKALEKAGTQKGMMSGSGSTVYGVFDDLAQAEAAAAKMEGIPRTWRVMSALLVG